MKPSRASIEALIRAKAPPTLLRVLEDYVWERDGEQDVVDAFAAAYEDCDEKDSWSHEHRAAVLDVAIKIGLCCLVSDEVYQNQKSRTVDSTGKPPALPWYRGHRVVHLQNMEELLESVDDLLKE